MCVLLNYHHHHHHHRDGDVCKSPAAQCGFFLLLLLLLSFVRCCEPGWRPGHSFKLPSTFFFFFFFVFLPSIFFSSMYINSSAFFFSFFFSFLYSSSLSIRVVHSLTHSHMIVKTKCDHHFPLPLCLSLVSPSCCSSFMSTLRLLLYPPRPARFFYFFLYRVVILFLFAFPAPSTLLSLSGVCSPFS